MLICLWNAANWQTGTQSRLRPPPVRPPPVRHRNGLQTRHCAGIIVQASASAATIAVMGRLLLGRADAGGRDAARAVAGQRHPGLHGGRRRKRDDLRAARGRQRVRRQRRHRQRTVRVEAHDLRAARRQAGLPRAVPYTSAAWAPPTRSMLDAELHGALRRSTAQGRLAGQSSSAACAGSPGTA